jgi:uncharacterized protein CbrC (UPF0167 family)
MQLTFIQSSIFTLTAFTLIACGGDPQRTRQNPQTNDPTYTVGGTIAGLVGTLVLKLNNDETLSTEDNGTFKFNDKLNDDDAYSVEISQAPFTQNCAITHASGQINAANVTNVSIICTPRAWIVPAITDSISPNTTGYFPRVAMDNNGNAIVVWAQDDGMFSQVYKAEFRNGTWTYPVDVNDNISPNTFGVSNPRVAMSDNGDALIVWTQSDGSFTQVFKAEYRNGAWTNPTNQQDNISPNNENADGVSVAMDSDGNALIAWSQSDSNLPQIFKAEYRNGSWTYPINLSDNVSVENQIASNANVAISDSGDAMIVWQQFTGVNVHLFKSEYHNGAWTHPTTINQYFTPDGGNAFNPSIAMSNQGNAVISWTQFDGDALQIFKAQYQNGSWIYPANLGDNISTDFYVADNSRVVMNNNAIVIAWIGFDGSNQQVYKAEYRNGSWTYPANQTDKISVSGQSVSNIPMANNLSLDIDRHGNTLIVWAQNDGTNMQLFKSVYQNGGWVHPASLTDNLSVDGFDVFDVCVAMSDSDKSVITWSQYNGSNTHIYKSEY